MRTLSIRQPWAWLIVNGHKDVENREWSTDYRGPLLIHASKTVRRGEYAEQARDIEEAFGIRVPALDDLPLGGIVGIATLTDCADTSDSPWWTGDTAWSLRDARPLPFHPCPGALRLFHTQAEAVGLDADAIAAASRIPAIQHEGAEA